MTDCLDRNKLAPSPELPSSIQQQTTDVCNATSVPLLHLLAQFRKTCRNHAIEVVEPLAGRGRRPGQFDALCRALFNSAAFTAAAASEFVDFDLQRPNN
jgi:hypothetical protein